MRKPVPEIFLRIFRVLSAFCPAQKPQSGPGSSPDSGMGGGLWPKRTPALLQTSPKCALIFRLPCDTIYSIGNACPFESLYQ